MLLEMGIAVVDEEIMAVDLNIERGCAFLGARNLLRFSFLFFFFVILEVFFFPGVSAFRTFGFSNFDQKKKNRWKFCFFLPPRARGFPKRKEKEKKKESKQNKTKKKE